MFEFGLDINEAQLHKDLMAHLSLEIEQVFKRAAPKIETHMRPLISGALRRSPEYSSMAAGQLQSEFGLVDGMSRMDAIIDTWTNSVNVEAKNLTMKITAISAEYFSILRDPAATFVTEKGSRLPWLEWLLLEGDRRIVLGYGVGPGRGRAGPQVMKMGGSWGVPAQYSGTVNNNFITRTVDSLEDEIFNLVKKEVEAQIK